MSAPYTLSCLFNGNIFDTYNCLVVNSNYILLYVTLLVIWGVIMAIFAGSERANKNTMLLASTITAIVSIVFLTIAAASGYSAAVISNYSSAALFCSVIAFAFLMYHILSDL